MPTPAPPPPAPTLPGCDTIRAPPGVDPFASVDGRELEVQLGQAAQDERRHVVVAAVAGRAVLLLGDPDVGGAVEQPLEADPRLGPGQRRAGAGVDAAAEREVLAGVRRGRCRTRRVARTGAGRGWRRR